MISTLHKIAIGSNRFFVIVGVAVLSLVVTRDLIHSTVRNYSFYLSESLLFSTFWLIFVPLSLVCIRQTRQKSSFFLPIVLSVFHLVFFSLFVFAISNLFFDDPFEFSRTFINTTSKYGIVCILFYGFCSFLFFDNEVAWRKVERQNGSKKIKVTYQNQVVLLNCNDIIYVKSEKPYVALITKDKTYLHSCSLKSFLEEHATKGFMQIHKSTLVNADYIVSYRSRKNGDYDIELSNQHLVRASHNYKVNFKPFFDNISLE